MMMDSSNNQHNHSFPSNGPRLFICNPNWFLILETIRDINMQEYTIQVSRSLLQYICYILTRNGVQTGFNFVKGTCGPYAKEVHGAILALANSNLLTEKQIPGGQMIEVHVAPSFQLKYDDYSAEEITAMESCVDLFCRIKNTKQAEMITTVIFEYDHLKKQTVTVSEQDILDGVLDWKKRWIGEKDEQIITTIRNMAMLGLIKPVPSFAEEEDLF